MNENGLRQLLRDADAETVISLQNTGGLPQAVRHRLNRRRQRMRAGVLTAAAVLAMAAIGSGLKYRAVQDARQIAAMQRRIMLAQIEAAEMLLLQMAEEEQPRSSEAEESVAVDPVRQIETHMDETAFALMYQAQRMAENYDDKQTALQLYRQVTDHFGQTQWAKEAQEKAAKLQPSQI